MNTDKKFHCLSRYVNFPAESVSYLSFGDVLDGKIQGSSKDDVLEVFGQQQHKQTVTAHSYSQFVKLANPDMFVTPSETLDASMGRKRRVRAAKQAVKFVQNCVALRTELDFPQCSLIAPIITQSEELESCPELKKLAAISDIDGTPRFITFP